MIESINLAKEYKKGKITVIALNRINFKINPGEFISIIGKSGSGKSTLLNLISGLDRPTGGELIINNRKLHGLGRKELANHRKFTVGMVFQSFNLIQSRTAIENITLALAFGGLPRKNRITKANELLKQVGLENRADHKPSELSGGETQRVAIARALANNPDIILADEPTGNLDSATSEEIMEIINDLNKKQGKTVIMVTHDKEMAQAFSNRIITLKDGEIVN